MNDKNDRTLMQNISYGWNSTTKAIKDFLEKYDAEAWPAFFVFLIVVTLGMILNFIAFRPIIGERPAAVISGVFEFAIVAWKIKTNRKKNNVSQNETANWATWISVALAITMLTVNLFRIGEAKFETVAYIIVGITASIQVIFYLVFDQQDPDKKMKRDFSQDARGLVRENQKATNVITRTETRMKIVRKIATELQRLNVEYSDLPTEQREHLLEIARKELLDQYAAGDAEVDNATAGLVDLNNDGKIGNQPINVPSYNPFQER